MKQRFYFVAIIAAIFSILLCSYPAMANVRIPMMPLVEPLAMLLLIPIILIEGFLAKLIFRTSWIYSFRFSAICNGASTLLGFPLTGIFLVILQRRIYEGGSDRVLNNLFNHFIDTLITHAPELSSYESELEWMLPLAATLFTFTFWLISMITEAVLGYIIRLKNQSFSKLKILLWSSIGNTIAYIPVLVWLAIYSHKILNLKRYT